jgi:acetylornithine/N-succinyldiaminopimelate aminotransferase
MRRLLPDFLLPTNERFDLAFERGSGAYLFGSDGRRYLDFCAGIAVSSLGHAHPHLVETLRRYADRAWHVSNNYRCPEQERLAAGWVEHSRSLAVLAATGNPRYLEGFGPPVPGFVQVRAGDVRALRLACLEAGVARLAERAGSAAALTHGP